MMLSMSMGGMLLIDTSYLIFYRCFALKVWMANAFPDKNVMTDDLLNIPEFCEKYQKTFLTTVEKIMKATGQTLDDMIFIRDCPSAAVWRKSIYPEYKATRDYSTFNGKSVFQWTYDTILPKCAKVAQFPELEADDTAAIIVRWMHQHHPNHPVIIITNDNDYLQLAAENPRVRLINLKEEDLVAKRSLGTPLRDLYKKIIMGDPSDNIPKVFERCGPKTLLKYADEPHELAAALDKNPEFRQRFELNEQLIDFRKIPLRFVPPVYEWCATNLELTR